MGFHLIFILVQNTISFIWLMKSNRSQLFTDFCVLPFSFCAIFYYVKVYPKIGGISITIQSTWNEKDAVTQWLKSHKPLENCLDLIANYSQECQNCSTSDPFLQQRRTFLFTLITKMNNSLTKVVNQLKENFRTA